MRYAAALRARGYDEEDIYAHLIAANGERCDPALDARGERDLRRIAAWVAQKPAGVVRSNVASEQTASVIETAYVVASAFSWRGRFAHTCRDVFLVLLAVMERTNKLKIDASVRDISFLTGYSSNTVSRSLRALSGKRHCPRVPVLLFHHISSRSYANSYALRQLNSLKFAHTLVKDKDGGRRVWAKMGELHDAFRSKRGLSTNCAVALLVIENECVRSARALAEKANLTAKTAERALTRLRAERLIVKRERRWQRTVTTLDEVAKRRGTLGYTKAQKIAHERERDTYAGVVKSPWRVGKLKLISVHTTERENESPSVLWEPELQENRDM